jgi:hypothetical protein
MFTVSLPHPVIWFRCTRASYRHALTVRELEARAALAEARMQHDVNALLSAGMALAGQPAGISP